MKKLFAVLVVALLVLTGCAGGSGAGVKDYSYVFSTDIDTLDYTFSMRNTNADHTSNFVDGLYELDPLGNFVPAMAESHEVSEDGLTHTYTIRKGVMWVTNTGEDFAEVTANDFVTGLKHATEKNSEMLDIVSDSIVGLRDYIKDPTIGFDKVGVTAKDDYTLVYTLTQPETYWNTKTNYGILFPVNAEFLASKGKDFGTTKPDSILYNGAYLLTNNTSKQSIEYKKNPTYWGADDVHVENVKLTYFDGQDPDSLYKQFSDGNYTVARVYPNSAGYETVKKENEANITTGVLDGAVYNFHFNFNRRSFKHSNKTAQEHKDFQAAALNRNFRLAMTHAFDREAYIAQNVGQDAAAATIRNDFMPPSFIKVDGVDYPKLVKEELNTLDKAQWEKIDLTDGHEAFYNPETAKAYADKAKAELKGVTFPIKIDFPVMQNSSIAVSRAQSFKKSVEDSLGKDFVVINIIELDEDPYMAATYYSETGATADYDMSNASGWGPDFVDPSTYLNIYNTKDGAMLKNMGIDHAGSANDESAGVRKALRLSEYDALVEKADKIRTDEKARVEAYAKADAWFANEALQIPVNAGGGTPSVSKVVPFTRPYRWTGNGAQRFKYMKIQDKPVSKEQYEKLEAEWKKASGN